MIFYCTEISYPYCTLNEEESNHIIKVLRMKKDNSLKIINGKGVIYEGIIDTIEKKEVTVKLLKILKEETVNTNKLSIAISPVKNPARLDWFVEKATEIGVANIYPVIAERTEKATVKTERLRNIIVSAAKQSGQLFFPVIHPVQPMQNLINSATRSFDKYYIAHCLEQTHYFKDAYVKNETALILIGPEGDFTSKEIEDAVNKNYIPVSLGNSILRVETAGIVACSTVSMINIGA